MNHIKRGTALLLALFLTIQLSTGALAAEPAAPADSSLEAAALAAAQGAMTYGGADSVQYALWQDGALRLTGSCGVYSRTENRALTDEILYGIGSVSKIYTTVAVLQLAERHRLSLDAPVTRYLKDFTMADPRYRQITVRMLLNHSSGLMGSSFTSAMLFDDTNSYATDTLLRQLSTQRLKADPGAYSVYCNDGFTLAQLVVEAVSGMDFMSYVDAYILRPAGLDATYGPDGSFDPSLLAKTYHGADPRALPRECLNLAGAGGMVASAGDLAAFGGALTGTALLQPASLKAMAAPEYARGLWPETDAPDALSYGLGWDSVAWFPFSQNGIQALVKGGDTMYYHAGLVVLPEYRMAAAVLSSGGVSTYNEMAASQNGIQALVKGGDTMYYHAGLVVLPEYRMAAAVLSSGGVSTYNEMAASRMLAEALKAQGVTLDETVPRLPEAAPAPMPAELMKNAGYYGSTSAQYQVELTADGILTLGLLTLPDLPAQTFRYCADGTFRDAAGQTAVSFVRESNGQTYLYQQGIGQLPGLGALPAANYAAVKLPENPVSPDVQAGWGRILSSTFLPLDETYSSQLYLAAAQGDAAGQSLPRFAPGYAMPVPAALWTSTPPAMNCSSPAPAVGTVRICGSMRKAMPPIWKATARGIWKPRTSPRSTPAQAGPIPPFRQTAAPAGIRPAAPRAGAWRSCCRRTPASGSMTPPVR